MLAYSRKDPVFAFNLNHSNSYTDFPIPLPPGNYRVLFTTDYIEFGGYGRVDRNIEYFTTGELKEYGLKNLDVFAHKNRFGSKKDSVTLIP